MDSSRLTVAETYCNGVFRNWMFLANRETRNLGLKRFLMLHIPHSSAASMLASGPAVANVKPKLQAGSWTSFALFTLAVQ